MEAEFGKKLFNPFPGLRPFHENEYHLFFGREKHLEDIFNKLEKTRFIALVGSSGSGKSSLVKAGILPRLKNETTKRWQLASFRPGIAPMENLAKALAEQGVLEPFTDPSEKLDEYKETLKRNSLELVQLVRERLGRGVRLFILVDQFEEIFRFSQVNINEPNALTEAEQFVSLLVEATRQRDVEIYIMLTMRSDFMGECDQFLGLPEALNEGQYLIPRLNHEEMERIIVGPVKVGNGKISPRLVQKLVSDIGKNQDQLPVLQHALMRTWDIWEPKANTGKPIDIEDYEKTGGIEHALNTHAEESYSELKFHQKEIVEKVFKTITQKSSDNRGIRRPTLIDSVLKINEVSLSQLEQVVQDFRKEESGFVMPPAGSPLTPHQVLDISHESLMRNWTRLKNWVDEEAESAGLYRRLSESALLFEKKKGGLWRDPDLQIAVKWLEKQKPNVFWAGQYDSNYAIAIKFLKASIQEKDFLLAEKKRRKVVINSLVASFLVTSGALSLWAFSEQNTAQKNAKKAVSEKENAKKHEKIAIEERKIADEQTNLAKQNLKIADIQRSEAQKQTELAKASAEEARQQTQLAEQASYDALAAKTRADNEARKAIEQRIISDSLRVTAENSTKEANRLRFLQIAENLAIKSENMKGEIDTLIKPTLALLSMALNAENGGDSRDFKIHAALTSAYTQLVKENAGYTRHTEYVKSVLYFGEDNTFYSSGDDGLIYKSAENGVVSLFYQSEKSNNDSRPTLKNLTGNAQSTLIACSSSNDDIRLFSTSNAGKVQIIKSGQTEISGLVFTRDYLVSTSYAKTIVFMDQDGKNAKNLTLASKINAVCAGNSANSVFLCCENGEILLAYIKDNQIVTETITHIPNEKPKALDYDKNTGQIACGTFEGGLFLFKQQNAAEKQKIVSHNVEITSCQFGNGGYLATSGLDGKVNLYNLQANSDIPFTIPNSGWIFDISFSKNGDKLVYGGKEKSVRVHVIPNEELANALKLKIKRNLTSEEWNIWVGKDIPYRRLID